MRSAFSGYIPEIPFILVDNFENDLSKDAYFLSHYHGDHVFGLDSDELCRRLKRNNVYIYASMVTIAIIKETHPRLSPYLKVLELGSNTISLNVNNEEVFLSVTTLPAGHSLGSVMFLFRYNKKKILYTGDFRISRNSVSKYSHFHSNSEPICLDVMYVDTTFQDYCMFPKRSEVVRNTVFHIRNWLNLSERHQVLLITCANYGYEYICNIIYDETKLKTYVDDSHWRVYNQFPKEMYGVTNDSTSRIYLTTKRMKKSYNVDHNPLTLQVYFSAYKWGNTTNIEEEYITVLENRIEVCFCTHCGRDELVHFINYLKPAKIVGFPEEYKTDNNMNVMFDSQFPEIDVSEEFKISQRTRKIVKERLDEERVGKRVSHSLAREALDW